MEHEDFKKQLDELFRLFNKLMEQKRLDDVPGIDRFQLEQMKMLLRNYDQMKDHISYEMMGQMNEPMRQMIGLFIKQLKEELGETEDIEIQVHETEDNFDNLQQVDELLRQPGLSEEEINRLLDERARIVNEKQQSATDSSSAI